MIKDTEQNVSQGDNSKAVQVAGDYIVQEGVSEERCRIICLDVYKNNIMQLQDEAREIALARVSEFTDIFIQKLTKQDAEIKRIIEESLKEPAMQEAIFKAQKCYAFTNEADHLEMLTDMLIDRGKLSQRNNRQMLIDDAIEVLPKLTSKHLDIIDFYIDIVGVTYVVKDKTRLDKLVYRLIEKANKIFPIVNNDFQYLVHRNCFEFNHLGHIGSPELVLALKARVLSEGFSRQEFELSVPYDLVKVLTTQSLIKDDNLVFVTGQKEVLQEYLTKNQVSQDLSAKIFGFWQDKINTDKTKEYLLNTYPSIKSIFDNWKDIEHYNITTLGTMIGLAYIKSSTGETINWDFE